MQVPLRVTTISFFHPCVSCITDSTSNLAFSRHAISKAEQKGKIQLQHPSNSKAETREIQVYAMHPHLPSFFTHLQLSCLEQASMKCNVITHMYLSSLVSGHHLNTIHFGGIGTLSKLKQRRTGSINMQVKRLALCKVLAGGYDWPHKPVSTVI